MLSYCELILCLQRSISVQEVISIKKKKKNFGGEWFIRPFPIIIISEVQATHTEDKVQY